VDVVVELACSYRVKAGNPHALSDEELRDLQLHRLNETLEWARQHCSFHATRIPQDPLSDLKELRNLPLMDESALTQEMTGLLGVGQGAVSRIVTVPTSGTTGTPKRIAFTKEEHTDIVTYLASGMRMLVQPGETIAVLYPCEREGGLGQLICEGIEQVPAKACAYGLPDAQKGFAHLAQTCLNGQVRGMVGFPQHIFALARWCEHNGIKLPITGVLLSADNVVSPLKQEIERIWGAQVYAHYGTTEMGYGGAVECRCGRGQHIRETDLLFEIIDPLSGNPLPTGKWGELVFTTLNRRAMPFIRYRTGDMTRFLSGSCECGSILRRIDVVKGRRDESLPICMYDLEDILFAIPGVQDFDAGWDGKASTLILRIQVLPGLQVNVDELGAMVKKTVSGSVGKSPFELRISQSAVDEYRPLYTSKRVIKHETRLFPG